MCTATIHYHAYTMVKCMVLWGEPGTMIDACIYVLTVDELHIQFDIIIIISMHDTFLSVQATVYSYMNRSMIF